MVNADQEILSRRDALDEPFGDGAARPASAISVSAASVMYNLGLLAGHGGEYLKASQRTVWRLGARVVDTDKEVEAHDVNARYRRGRSFSLSGTDIYTGFESVCNC